MHAPAEHAPSPQSTPHAPQLWGSSATRTQTPEHGASSAAQPGVVVDAPVPDVWVKHPACAATATSAAAASTSHLERAIMEDSSLHAAPGAQRSVRPGDGRGLRSSLPRKKRRQ
jgi:hypothetical protein